MPSLTEAGTEYREMRSLTRDRQRECWGWRTVSASDSSCSASAAVVAAVTDPSLRATLDTAAATASQLRSAPQRPQLHGAVVLAAQLTGSSAPSPHSPHATPLARVPSSVGSRHLTNQRRVLRSRD